MQVTVVKAGRKPRDLGALQLPEGATVAQLKLAFEQTARVSRHRQSFKLQAGDALVVRGDPDSNLNF